MEQAAALIGSQLADRYRLVEVIGEGGMGRVFRAERLATGEPVAVKLLHPEFADVDQIVQRFEREAKVTTQLAHPNIVKVIEFGEWNGRLFLAMELIAGRSLAELIERDGGKSGQRMTVKRTLALMRSVLDALEYAHGLGVVHRDLKPENIMVIPGRGILGRESIKLLDFGIAKLGDHSERAGQKQKLTQHGLVLGTPGYMSPEQAAGQEADVRSDLYSCGVILYQMLAGRRPFVADSNLDVLVMHLNTPPTPLEEVAPDAWIPPGVDAVVLRALAKRPAERFQSAGALRQALERAVLADYSGLSVDTMGATILAPSRPAAPPPRLPVIRFAIVAAALAIVLGHHLPLRASASGEQVHRAHAGGGAPAAAPAPAHDHDDRPSTGVASAPPPRATHPIAKHAIAKHDAKPTHAKARAKAKKLAHRKH